LVKRKGAQTIKRSTPQVLSLGLLLVFVVGGQALNDTWEYDGHTWWQVYAANTPDARAAAGMAYDAAGRHRAWSTTPTRSGSTYTQAGQDMDAVETCGSTMAMTGG